MSPISPLLGAIRLEVQNDANDPSRHLRPVICCATQRGLATSLLLASQPEGVARGEGISSRLFGCIDFDQFPVCRDTWLPRSAVGADLFLDAPDRMNMHRRARPVR